MSLEPHPDRLDLDGDALFAELSDRIERLADQAGDLPADDWLYAAFDRWQDTVTDRAPGGDASGPGLTVLGLACDQGCSHCCHQVVQLTVLEARLLASGLIEALAPDELAELHDRLRQGWQTLQRQGLERLTLAEQVAALNAVRRPCPLLDREAGRCRAYALRPIACRREHSRDADACRRFLEDPSLDLAATRVPALDAAWSAVRRLIQSWIEVPEGEHVGTHVVPLELGLLIALEECDEPDGAEEASSGSR